MKRVHPRSHCQRVRWLVTLVALFTTAGEAANEPDEDKLATRTQADLPPYHPHLEPAPWLTEMDPGELPEDATLQDAFGTARALFPELAHGAMPSTDFGVIVHGGLASSAVLFREVEGEPVVEKRETKRGRLGNLRENETPAILTASRPLHPDIATAAVSVIRRALANARPYRPVLADGVERIVLSDVSYYFFSGGIAGKAHAPDSDTEAGALDELSMVLREFVDGYTDERDVRLATENALRAKYDSSKDR